MDGGNVDVAYACVVGEDREERDEGVIVVLGLVVVDDARFLRAGLFTDR